MMRLAGEIDPSLRRVQRDSAVVALAAAAVALVIEGGRPEGALGVLAGAGLMGFSYAAIKGGVTALLQRAAQASRAEPGEHHAKASVAWLLARFIGRYLVVGIVAWVVLVPLRAHPLGLFAGVTAPVVAIGIEAIRLVRRTGPTGAPAPPRLPGFGRSSGGRQHEEPGIQPGRHQQAGDPTRRDEPERPRGHGVDEHE